MKKYTPVLDILETQKAIRFVRHKFEDILCENLCLSRASAPLFVKKGSGLNDDLNGVERPVAFDILETGEIVEVVHSLAKWKRMALGKYNFPVHTGLYTDMNAIRRDEKCDNIHSLYVDQWDWEKVITKEDRTEDYLKETVRKIYEAVYLTAEDVEKKYPQLKNTLKKEISFVTTYELEEKYPALTPKEREDAIAKELGSVFIMKIGGRLKNGEKHDGRAPDYDDWNLNGDIVIYNEVIERAFEISSMGIRVDADSLKAQLKAEGKEDRLNLPFHKALINGELPLTIGGGIGQSRFCMLMLKKAHIGEVHASVWPDSEVEYCKEIGAILL